MNDVTETNAITIASETMLGDLMQVFLQEIKVLGKPWENASEYEQQEILDRVQSGCSAAVDQCVNIIAAEGRTVLDATVEQVVFKDGIKAVLTVGSLNPGRHALADHCNESVLIVISDGAKFKNTDTAPKPTPDQADLVAAAQKEAA